MSTGDGPVRTGVGRRLAVVRPVDARGLAFAPAPAVDRRGAVEEVPPELARVRGLAAAGVRGRAGVVLFPAMAEA
ncbi:hypothetical protein [Nakamurella antarctica]|uniref:hypothetical protein n=1 Tax=Nakamurella antarctica TaxID=1902245 RepID=UPI001EF11E59|nr:hypothetical protein [Nakamurella antarctica]